MLEKLRRGVEQARRVEDIIALREWLATMLQAPGTYVFAGDALGQIYAQLKGTFSVDFLGDLVMRKIQLLDRLYEDILQLEWLNSRPSRE